MINGLNRLWERPAYHGPPPPAVMLWEAEGVRGVRREGDTVSITVGTPRQARLLESVLEPELAGERVKIESATTRGAASALRPGEIKAVLADLTGGTATADPRSYTVQVRPEEVSWADGMVRDSIGGVPVRILAQ